METQETITAELEKKALQTQETIKEKIAALEPVRFPPLFRDMLKEPESYFTYKDYLSSMFNYYTCSDEYCSTDENTRHDLRYFYEQLHGYFDNLFLREQERKAIINKCYSDALNETLQTNERIFKEAK